ncbi:MAG: hypothetical protein IT260_18685 [Saprospiraceae bacterium]|nr:hypothetical protein [Saprospiraceae bacterium]
METAKHIAVVYSSVHRFGYQLPTYFVAVFDKEGLLISKNQIASLSLHEIQAVTIHRHLNATLQTYWLNWEKNIDTAGVDGNRITGLTLVATTEIDLKKTNVEAPLKIKDQPAAKREPVVQQSGAK